MFQVFFPQLKSKVVIIRLGALFLLPSLLHACKTKKPPSFITEEMGFHFFCNPMTGHLILLLEAQKTDRN